MSAVRTALSARRERAARTRARRAIYREIDRAATSSLRDELLIIAQRNQLV